jgi:hypothetical protein
MSTMLILRGISGKYANENGKIVHYKNGALHDGVAVEYAKRKSYIGKVLDVDGATGPESKQTKMALEEFRRDQTVAAFFGFSGGGYNVRHILNKLTDDERSRVKLIVVLGAPKNSADVYQASKYGNKAKWELVYKTNPAKTAPFVPKGAGTHMFGPEWLLWELDNPKGK